MTRTDLPNAIDEPGRFRDGLRRATTLLLVGAVVAAGSTVASILLSTPGLAARMAHPVRFASHGTIPETTLEGAAWFRLALGVVPWIALALLAIACGVARREPTGERTNPTFTRASVLSLLLALAVGLLLRVIHLGDSLWYDELAGLLGYSQYGPAIIGGNYFSQANHPLSQMAIWLSASLLGVNEITLRLPALLAGTLTIPAAWLLGREARGEGMGLLMAAVVALLPLACLASSDARGYAFVILFATVAGWLLLRGLRTGEPLVWLGLAVVHALLVYSHLAAVCVALGQGLSLLAALRSPATRRNAIAGLAALAAAAGLTLLLYAPLLPDLLERRASFTVAGSGGPTLAGPETLHALYGLGGSWTWWASLPGIALALIGLPGAVRDPRLRRALAITGLGVPVAYLLAAAGGSWLYARFLLFALPFTAILIASGLGTLAALGRLPLVMATAALVGAGAVDLLQLPPRQDLRGGLDAALAPINGRTPSVWALGLNDQVLLYYAQSSHYDLHDLGNDGATIARQLDTAKPDRVIVLYPRLRPNERVGQLETRGYRPVLSLPGWIDWGEGEVELWERGPG